MGRFAKAGKGRILGYKSIVTLILIAFLVGIVSQSYSKTLSISNKLSNKVIQNLLFNTTDGDTIFVKSGVYYINNIIVNKKISIIGYNYPVFNANFKTGDLLTILSDSVRVSGLKLINVPLAHTSDNAAIKIRNCSNVEIDDIITLNCFFGIYIANSDNCKIRGNNLTGNFLKETSSGNGIHLWKCNNITISKNIIKKHRDGIYFEFVKNTLIVDNISQSNKRYGLHFMFSDSCKYNDNQFIDNGAGVAVMYTKVVSMERNKFRDNWGTASYGILLKDIRDSQINNNTFENNTVGIYAEGSNRIIIKNNDFIRNGWALKIMGDCLDNVITYNNFIGNSFDVATNSTQSYNIFKSNYWSNYEVYDMNKDGFGDIPYYPVSLFSLIIENSPPALVLMHSIFVNLLELGERIFPSIIPKKIVDDKPYIRRIYAKF